MPAVAVTFALWLLCGLALYAVHDKVVASLGPWGADSALDEPSGYDEPGYGEEDDYVPYAEPGSDPDDPNVSPAY